jgi:hypothetical protein
VNVGDITHEVHCGPVFALGSNRSEYQGYLLGCEGGQCVGRTILPLSCAECLEILGVSNPWNPKGLSRSIMGYFCLLLTNLVCYAEIFVKKQMKLQVM